MADDLPPITEEQLKLRLWSVVLDDLRDLSKTHPNVSTFLGQLEHSAKTSVDLSIKIEDGFISCNGKTRDLRRSEMLLRVFQTFKKFPHQKLDRMTLINQVYGPDYTRTYSKRQQGCLRHNIVKLVSRARRLASHHFKDESGENLYEWFPYDPSSQSWRFFRYKDDMIETLAGEMQKIFRN